MDAELEAYDRAWRETPKEGGERNALCQRLADEYVARHPEVQLRYIGLTIPECVAILELAREAGDEAKRIEVDIWINAAFEYQQIGGSLSTDGTHRPLPEIDADGLRRVWN